MAASINRLPQTSEWTIESKLHFPVYAFLSRQSLEPAGAVRFSWLFQEMILIFLSEEA